MLLLLLLELELLEKQKKEGHKDKTEEEGVRNEASLERCHLPRFTRESSTRSRFVCGDYVGVGMMACAKHTSADCWCVLKLQVDRVLLLSVANMYEVFLFCLVLGSVT